MSAKHYRRPEDTFQAPASYGRGEVRGQGGQDAADRACVQPDTRTLRDGADAAPRVDQTLVSPVRRGRVAAEGYRPLADPQADAARDQRVLHRATTGRPVRPVPSPPGYAGDYGRDFEPVPERRRGGRGMVRVLLLLLAWVLRLAAIGLAALVVLDAFTLGNRLAVLQVTTYVTSLLPDALAGVYVLDTPFGGAFRGDFAIASLALFVLDWVCMRIRRALR